MTNKPKRLLSQHKILNVMNLRATLAKSRRIAREVSKEKPKPKISKIFQFSISWKLISKVSLGITFKYQLIPSLLVDSWHG